MNTLYYGDNLEILRKHVKDDSVDLIYLDPPFNSQRNYNITFEDSQGQTLAFEDTWKWEKIAVSTYKELQDTPYYKVIESLKNIVGENSLMAYLCMMAIRLIELKRVLKTTGSIYLHCDTEASHYLKILMDHLFGMENYRAEITWKRYGGNHNAAKRNFGDIVDVILYYSRSSEYYFQPQYTELDSEYVKRQYRFSDERGRYMKTPMSAPSKRPFLTYEWKGFQPPKNGWRYSKETMEKLYSENRIWLPTKEDGTFDFTKRPRRKTYLHEVPGKAVSNLWDDIPALSANDAERLGYPTQKPVSLLERILKTSSKEGDVVLDPFCGCGATIVASQKLNRQWVGIDITHLAIAALKSRLQDAQFEIVGEPKTVEDAKRLAEQDRYQFQWWALSLIKASPVGDEKKKGKDRGIDGILRKDGKTTIVSVKSGKITSSHIRDLMGTITREKIEEGILITLEDTTKGIEEEVLSLEGKIKVLRIKDLL